MTTEHETCSIQLTPPGRSALATIAIVGPEAKSYVEKFFRPATPRWPGENQMAFGHWREFGGEEVVVCLRQDDHCEVHCHGGIAAVAAILGDLREVGCDQENNGRWIDRIAGDPLVAAAMELLPNARTERTAAILLDQFNGALSREVAAILVDVETNRFAAADNRCKSLLSTAQIGLHLTTPWKVVIAGRTNVGKSSLINALVGYQRSITFDQPGTTRDLVSANTSLDGWPVELFDTAGLRAAGHAIETAGVALAEQQLLAADVRILVFDGSKLWTDRDQRLLSTWPDVVVAHNKCDLAKPDENRPGGIDTCAVNGDGVSKLISEIVRQMIPRTTEPGKPVLFTTHQISCLQAILDASRRDDPAAAMDACRELRCSRTNV